MQQDDRIDAYIAKAAPFAQPILTHIRAAMHRAIPQGEEAIKWSMPFFLLNGKPFANMAAFKAHAAFGFWKGPRTGKESDAMGQYGKLAALDDLPGEAELIALIRAQADAAATPAPPRPKAPPKAAIGEPADFTAALAANAAARARFDALPPGARREYLEWIVEARQQKTRAARIEKAVAQTAEGRKLNWKYEKC